MWRTVKLGDFLTVQNGYAFNSKLFDADGDIGLIRIRDLKEGTSTETRYTGEFDSKFVVQSGDLLIGMDGEFRCYEWKGENALLNQRVCRLQDFNKDLDKRFLLYSINDELKKIEDVTGFTTVKHLSSKTIKEIQLQLPPLAEQQRIVAKLDAAFAEIDRAIEATKSAADNLHKALVQHLHHCFSSIENDSYRYVGDVAEHCLGKMLDKKKNKGEPKPYLRNLNVRWFKVATDDLLEMKFESHEHERYSVRNGDLLICEGGYPGRAAIWNGDDEIYIQKAIHRVRFQNQNQNVWLMYYLFYLDVTDNLKQYFTGSGIQHFTGKALAKLPLPYLEDDIVTERLQTISMMQKHIEFASSIFERKVAALDSLKSAILAQELQPREAA